MTLGGSGPLGIYKTKEKYIIFYKFFEFGLKKIVLAPPPPPYPLKIQPRWLDLFNQKTINPNNKKSKAQINKKKTLNNFIRSELIRSLNQQFNFNLVNFKEKKFPKKDYANTSQTKRECVWFCPLWSTHDIVAISASLRLCVQSPIC